MKHTRELNLELGIRLIRNTFAVAIYINPGE